MTAAGVTRTPRPSSLADVLEVVLDKGIVIDAYIRVAVVGIELLTVDARIVIASVDTYLRFAEAVNRLDLQPNKQVAGLPGLMDEIEQGGAESKTKGALAGVKDSAKDMLSNFTSKGDNDDEDEGEQGERAEKPASTRRGSRSRKSGDNE